jgi:hypothetical protein
MKFAPLNSPAGIAAVMNPTTTPEFAIRAGTRSSPNV